jgi:hypothetical protein
LGPDHRRGRCPPGRAAPRRRVATDPLDACIETHALDRAAQSPCAALSPLGRLHARPRPPPGRAPRTGGVGQRVHSLGIVLGVRPHAVLSRSSRCRRGRAGTDAARSGADFRGRSAGGPVHLSPRRARPYP